MGQPFGEIAPQFEVEGSLVSPNIGNYYIGKGSVAVKLIGETKFTLCGNCPTFEFQAKVTKLDHYSSQTGVRIKDFTAVTELNGTLTMVLEEFTARNMGFALMGFASGAPSPSQETISVFSEPVIYGAVQFVGANDIGPRWTITFPLVSIQPSKAVSLIGNTWGTIDLTGDVLFDQLTQTFGTASVQLPNSPTTAF